MKRAALLFILGCAAVCAAALGFGAVVYLSAMAAMGWRLEEDKT